MSDSVSHDASNEISEALRKIAESNHKLLAAMQHNNLIVLQAVQMLTQSITRPRRIVHDETGKPIGSEPV